MPKPAWQFSCTLAAWLVGFAISSAQDATSADPTARSSDSLRGDPTQLVLPLSPTQNSVSGLTIGLRGDGNENYGYRRLTVVASDSAPSAFDRLITVRFRLERVVVEQHFEIPTGAMSASASMAVPFFHTGGNPPWKLDVWVDGMRDPTLSADHHAWGARGTAITSAVSLPWLPRLYLFSTIVANRQQLEAAKIAGLDPQTYSLPSDMLVRHGKLTDFPTRWIAWTTEDIVTLSAQDLRTLATQHPEARLALQRWIRTGGCLWVSDVGAGWRRLKTIQEALELPDDAWETEPLRLRGGTRTTKDGSVAAAAAAIERFKDRDFGSRRSDRPSGQAESFSEYQPPVSGRSPGRPASRVRDAAPTAPHRVAALGMGKVVAFPNRWYAVTPGNFPGPLAHGSWPERHGLAPDHPNVDFANWLIPGVGLAPVGAFRILISLFVLGIGPLNYWLLTRWNRQHLLVLSVPLVSLLATLALFAYALLGDGLSTRARVRSYAELDQRTGEAVCWSRLSYYAGLAPAEGLTMPADTVVYPILSDWANLRRRARDRELRELIWQSDAQQLTAGWLSSRRPTQYLTIRARNSPHEIRFHRDGAQLTADNRLGTAIRQLVVMDEQGSLLRSESIGSGETRALEPTTRGDVFSPLLAEISAHEPQLPAAFASRREDYLQRSRRRSRNNQSRFEPDNVRLTGNLLNSAIATPLGLNGGPALNLPNRSYLALTERGVEVDLGLPAVQEQGSLHLLIGRW